MENDTCCRGGVAIRKRRPSGWRTFLLSSAALFAASASLNPALADQAELTIPSMPLNKALKEFGAQAGVSIVFSDQATEGLASVLIEGRYEAEDALSLILSKTDLKYQKLDEKTFVVREASFRSAQGVSAMPVAASAALQVGAGSAPASRGASRDTIVVTAQKRDQRAIDVPISLTAFGSEELKSISPQRLNDLQYLIPNVISVVSFDHSAGSYSIRGIAGGSSGNIGREAAAAVSVDGVFMGRTAAFNQDLIEIERVEVLRGPQGTLQGKNTMSGAINIITKRPDEEPEAKVQLTGGNFGLFRGNASISGPISDAGLFGKATVFGIRSDGYVDNINNGQNLNNEQAVGGRVHLRYAPNDRLDVNLTGDLMRERRARYNFEPLQGAPFVVLAEELDEVNFNQPVSADRDVGGVSLSVDYGLGGGLTISSISAWRYLDLRVVSDGDATAFDSIIGTNEEQQDQFTQEVRISTGQQEWYDIVVGAFYFHQSVDGFNSQETRPEFPFGEIGTLTQDGNVTTNSFAGFVHGIFDLTEKLELGAGLRYTHEDREFLFTQNEVPLFPFVQITDFTDTQDEGAFAPTASLTYALSDNANIYVKYARGFKGGGFNFSAVTNAQLSFDAETVDSYEVGLKSSLYEQRLQVNLAGFYMDYSDQQVTLLLGPGGINGNIIANAASSTSWGIEFDVNAQPTENFNISAGFGFTKAEFGEFFDGVSDFSGNRLQQAPRFNGNVSATYTIDLKNTGAIVMNGVYSYQDDFFLDPANASLLPSRNIANARVGYEAPGETWSLYLWSRNLFDERVAENFGGDPLGFVTGSAFNQPRTFGAELNFKF